VTTLPAVWLLDVDGVVNAVAAEGDPSVWPAYSWQRRRVAPVDDGYEYSILTADPVLDFLRGVDAAGRAEIRWHTTWQRSAPLRISPALNLPAWPVADAPEFTHHRDSGYAGVADRSWWKLAAAQRVVSLEGRRLLWTDDDIDRVADAALAALVGRPDVLALSPDTATGLTADDLRRCAEFLNPADASL
jgi:hypothetical protein